MLQHVHNFFSKKCVLPTRLGHKEYTAFVSHFLTFPRKQDTCKSNAAIESSGFPLGRHALKKKFDEIMQHQKIQLQDRAEQSHLMPWGLLSLAGNLPQLVQLVEDIVPDTSDQQISFELVVMSPAPLKHFLNILTKFSPHYRNHPEMMTSVAFLTYFRAYLLCSPFKNILSA